MQVTFILTFFSKKEKFPTYVRNVRVLLSMSIKLNQSVQMKAVGMTHIFL